MALTTYTITIVNKNVAPVDVVGEGYKPIVVISPTGVTTPDTPYAEWVADNTSRLDGSVAIPAWKKLQYFILPATSKLVLVTDIADEAIYYQGLVGKFDNVKITVEDGDNAAPITTYKVTLTATGAKVGAADVAPTATSTPAGLGSITLTYSSNDEEIATIVSNKVHAVKAGTFVLTGTGTATLEGETIAVSAKTTVTVAAAD